jgi:tRNA(Ile)-lysidine synthase
MSDLQSHIAEYWDHLKQKHLFVACSGGVDSIALLHLLHQHNYTLSVIHVNYQLRGEDSNLDALCVQNNCKVLGIPCEIRTVDLESQLSEGGNLQGLARDVRYAWFEEILSDNATNCILLAHHADDQVETFFLNLARKSGVMGLSCMPAERGRIYRPLLNYFKQDLIDFATELSLPWREDASNKSTKYSRNRLRNEIIPELRLKIPSIQESILLLVEHFQSLQKSLEEAVRPFYTGIKDTGAFDLEDYNQLDDFKRIELFRQLGISAKIVERVDQLLTQSKGKKIDLDHAIYTSIVRDHDQFSFLKHPEFVPQLTSTFVESLPIEYSKDEVYLDSNKIQGELEVRKWKLGDRIAPLGMKGTQLISDIIKDAKITASKKQRVLVVHDDDSIHWCVGLKVGRLAVATHNSTKIMRCSITAQEAPK